MKNIYAFSNGNAFRSVLRNRRCWWLIILVRDAHRFVLTTSYSCSGSFLCSLWSNNSSVALQRIRTSAAQSPCRHRQSHTDTSQWSNKPRPLLYAIPFTHLCLYVTEQHNLILAKKRAALQVEKVTANPTVWKFKNNDSLPSDLCLTLCEQEGYSVPP